VSSGFKDFLREREKTFTFPADSEYIDKSTCVNIVRAKMEDKLFTRKVWKPELGEHVIEVEDSRKMLVDTPYGKRKGVFIKVEGEPYVWFINHYGQMVEKAIETQLDGILEKRKSGKALIKVTVDEVEGRKLYDLTEVEATPDSIIVSVGIYVSDNEGGDYYLIHSDTIPIGGEK